MAFMDDINDALIKAQDYFENLDTYGLMAWGAIVLGIILVIVALFL